MSLSFTLNTPVKEMSAVKDETVATQNRAQNPAAWRPRLHRPELSLPEPLAFTREAGTTASPSHKADMSIK